MASFVATRKGKGRGPAPAARMSPEALRCRRKFLSYFPGGFGDGDYLGLERGYKWAAHERWMEVLNPGAYGELLRQGKFAHIALAAVRIESRTNLLFSFEKMAMRDAVKSKAGARRFARGLYDFLYGQAGGEERFLAWRDAVAGLPRRQTRVLTWPVLTVFPFLAEPKAHIFLKPTVTRRAAERYGFDFRYGSRPDWATYASLLAFGRAIERDQRDLRPKDRIDTQGFIWVQGSDEYPD